MSERSRRIEAVARSRQQAKGWDYEGGSRRAPTTRPSEVVSSSWIPPALFGGSNEEPATHRCLELASFERGYWIL